MNYSTLVVNSDHQFLRPVPKFYDAFLARVIQVVDYAFQPIVSIYTGNVYGYEALLRGMEKLGFHSVKDLFQYAENAGILPDLDFLLREKAFKKFAQLPNHHEHKLFFNLDLRTLDPAGDDPQKMRKLLITCGVQPEDLCLELSEWIDITANPNTVAILNDYRKLGFQIAIDDFGTGFSGLKLLYEQPPDLLKIDRFFITDIDKNYKKRWFVSNMMQLAHVSGSTVIIEGIETEAELLTCKDIGCDMIQGFFVAKPTVILSELFPYYAHIQTTNRLDRSHAQSERVLIEAYLDHLPYLIINSEMQQLFDTFRAHKLINLIPILDETRRPLGVVFEADIKDYTYSAYGRDLIINRSYRKKIRDFLRPCPVIDICQPLQRFLESCANHENSPGLLVTENFRYLGFISAIALLRLLDEKNLALARDQNPLTRLPGNSAIYEYIIDDLSRLNHDSYLIYFDFDNFKGFNDQYGFQRGDRAILLFVELARRIFDAVPNYFLGHVGGDDFFAGIRNLSPQAVYALMEQLQIEFCDNVQSLYDAADLKQGFLYTADRYGQFHRIPLMRCSIAVLSIRGEFKDNYSSEMITSLMADIKKQAKSTPSGLIIFHVQNRLSNHFN